MVFFFYLFFFLKKSYYNRYILHFKKLFSNYTGRFPNIKQVDHKDTRSRECYIQTLVPLKVSFYNGRGDCSN
jgi:hypothetical protein